MHIPGPQSLYDSILVVGEPDGVLRAVAHINKIEEKWPLSQSRRRKHVIAAEAAVAAASSAADEDALEPWTESYTTANGH